MGNNGRPRRQRILCLTGRNGRCSMAADKITSEPVTEKVKGPASYFPSIEKKYGRPIADWKALIRSRPGERHMDLVNWLKTEHDMGHGHANALVGHTLDEIAKEAKSQ